MTMQEALHSTPRMRRPLVALAIALATLSMAAVTPALAAGTDPGGTAAGTTVQNQASVTYEVGSVAQPPVLSDDDGNPANGANPTEFVVDRKLDVLVAEDGGAYNSASTPTVVPGQAQGAGNAAVLAFTVTNEGNAVVDFLLSAAPTGFDPFGGTDTFDATNVNVFVDVDDNGVFDPVVDNVSFIDELGITATRRVFVVGDIDAARVDGDIAAYVLTAQVAEGGGVGAAGAAIVADDSGIADTVLGVEDVFADDENVNNGSDAVRDGLHSAEDAWLVSAATLTVAKTSAVISDPFTCPGAVCPPGAQPKAIPGAIIEYVITVTNGPGAATATNLVVSDDLSAEIVGGGGTQSIGFVSDQYGGTGDIQLTVTPAVGAPVVTNLTEQSDADSGQFAANVITVNGITLAASESAAVRFRVEIQ